VFFSPTEFHSRAAVQKPLDPSSLTHRQHTRARPVLVPPRVRSADGRVALLVFFCFVFFKSLLLSSSFIIFYFEFSGSTGRIQNEFFFSPYLTGLCVCDLSLSFSSSSFSLYLSTEVTASGGFSFVVYLFYFHFVTFLFSCSFSPPFRHRCLACIATHFNPTTTKKLLYKGFVPALSIHYLVIFSLEQTDLSLYIKERHTAHIHIRCQIKRDTILIYRVVHVVAYS
jgi:hypothetical protein